MKLEQLVQVITRENPNLSLPLVAIEAQLRLIEQSQVQTVSELYTLLDHSLDNLGLRAGCDLFIRFLNRQDLQDFSVWKQHVIEKGRNMVNCCVEFRQLCCDTALPFLSEGSFLVHGYSRLVILLLKQLAETTRFQVFVTQALPMDNGARTVRELRDSNIMACLVSDSSIGHVMHHVDTVLVGAQVITQNGGLVNQMGTLQLAIVAKALNKPFYVLSESFKFLLMFPLDQDDLPIKMDPKFTADEDNGKLANPRMDYTPPEYVTLFFTDLGVLTPSGVAEQLLNI